MQSLRSQASPSAHHCSALPRCPLALFARPHRSWTLPSSKICKRCVSDLMQAQVASTFHEQDCVGEIRHVCRSRKHQGCSAQGQNFQEQIREITESLPVQGWPLFAIVSACAALAAYTALQILLWDYKVRVPGHCNCQILSASATPRKRSTLLAFSSCHQDTLVWAISFASTDNGYSSKSAGLLRDESTQKTHQNAMNKKSLCSQLLAEPEN